ncbi:MAG: UDP-N-acetylmuramoyl-L-alanine--D-glutamate ligase [Nitrosomonadales bacterium]|nr:UDP-N-acetylmuramoyl-L-alanine--D-glutamate ligase [Nitrosomonadales bacterium]
MEWASKNILVLGLGETGLSLVRWFNAKGARLRVADSRNFPPGLATLQEKYPDLDVRCGVFRSELLDGIDLIAISPGIPMAEVLVQRALSRKIPVVGDIEILARQIIADSAVRPTKVIAITGANGKTTVTSMVGAMCRAAGLDTVVAGNISPAVLDVLMDRDGKQPDIWVLELSSFQLETTSSLDADAATVLNISEDHLDRYADMNEYIGAKARIFRSYAQRGVQVLNRDDANSMEMALRDRIKVTFGLSTPMTSELDWGVESSDDGVWLTQGSKHAMRSDELQVAGLHNAANALAALALCRAVGIPLRPLVEALRNFKGLPHRVEKIAEINGVDYYDDSKGTNVGATVAALQGLGRKSVLIAGGDGKGQDFTPLHPVVAAHARAVVLIGRDAPTIETALWDSGVQLLRAADLPEAVKLAASLALPGDAVLLSPACASFDMFRNYQHRAEVYVVAVQALQQGGA